MLDSFLYTLVCFGLIGACAAGGAVFGLLGFIPPLFLTIWVACYYVSK